MLLKHDVKALLQKLGDSAFVSYETLPIEGSRKIIDDSHTGFPLNPVMALEKNEVFLYNGIEMPYKEYVPEGYISDSTIIFMHGGGWVFGSIVSHDHLARSIANSGKCVLISLGYPLAPEFKHPFALDCICSFIEKLSRNEISTLIPNQKLLMCGDSAGGNLAAAVCIKMTEKSMDIIKGQILLYPVIKHSFDSNSYISNKNAPILSKSLMEWFWKQYLDDESSLLYADLTVTNLPDGLPPALIIAAEYDPLCDEAEEYSKKLSDIGCDVIFNKFLGVFHGFVRQSHLLESGVEALNEIAKFVDKYVNNNEKFS